jgi:hypothetical protein
MLGVVNISLHDQYTSTGLKNDRLFPSVQTVSSCFLNGKTSSTTCFLSNIYNCIELWTYFSKTWVINRYLTKISTYLNFSQNSFALGLPYNFTSYTTAKIFKLTIINLLLSKITICTSQSIAHTMFLFCCISKNISAVVWFTYLMASGISKLLRQYLFKNSW